MKKLLVTAVASAAVLSMVGCEQLIEDAAEERSSLTISLTDAEGDFLQYQVGVEALTLTNTKGDVINALPVSTDIDFVQYTDLSEILTIMSVPAGRYIEATMTLDYSDAMIVVQNANGDAIQVEAIDIVDTDGAPLTVEDVDIQFGQRDAEAFWMRAGKAAALSLDFDLAATHRVNFDEMGSPSIEAEPIIIADRELNTDREHRLRGLLDEVNVEDSEIVVDLRPFNHTARSGFGTVTASVSNETYYEIDREELQGDEGLAAMAELDASTPVVLMGSINGESLQLEVTTVYAGTSVPWAEGEIVRGVVIERSGDVVTVQGTRYTPADASVVLSDAITVKLTSDMTITRPMLGSETLTADHITVGSRVRFYDDDTADDAFNADLSRLLLNQLRARVNSVSNGELDVELGLLNGRKPDAYNFESVQVDADAFTIEAGSLANSTNAGDYVKVRGFMNAIWDYSLDAAQQVFESEMDATTVVNLNLSARKTWFDLQWNPAEASPFISLSVDGIEMDMTTVDEQALSIAGFELDDATLLQFESIDSGYGLFAIKTSGGDSVEILLTFEALVEEIQERFDNGQALIEIRGHGKYDESLGMMTTARMTFVFDE